MHREIRISTNAVPLCYVSIRKFECVIRPPLFRYPTVIISSPKSNRLMPTTNSPIRSRSLLNSLGELVAKETRNVKYLLISVAYFFFFFFRPLFFVDLGELMVRENIWRIILRRFIWRKFSRKDELENLFPGNFDVCSFNFFFIFFLEFQ